MHGRYSSVVERALCKRTVVGSNPTGGFVTIAHPECLGTVNACPPNATARVAQWIERWTSYPKVAGSSPAVGNFIEAQYMPKI